MKVVIVSCFDTYSQRIDAVSNYFIKKGYSYSIITANFSHSKKIPIINKREGITYLNVTSYKKNISIRRLISHVSFSKKTIKKIEELKPDLIYALVPPNSIVQNLSKYKIKNNDVKLIYDIIDLWPETMPISKYKNNFPFILWKNLRDNWIKYADYIITECELFSKKLNFEKYKSKTLYFSRTITEYTVNSQQDKSVISLAYLGSINNIIDISEICNLIKFLKKDKFVELYIIGNGEKSEEFITRAKNSGAQVTFFESVYDNKKKAEIFSRCNFGLNIYKDNTVIGLTMKSIDYLELGLPIINNIKGDTYELVNEYNLGINLEDIYTKEIRYDFSNRYIKNFAGTIFSYENFCNEMDLIIDDVFKTDIEVSC